MSQGLLHERLKNELNFLPLRSKNAWVAKMCRCVVSFTQMWSMLCRMMGMKAGLQMSLEQGWFNAKHMHKLKSFIDHQATSHDPKPLDPRPFLDHFLPFCRFSIFWDTKSRTCDPLSVVKSPLFHEITPNLTVSGSLAAVQVRQAGDS